MNQIYHRIQRNDLTGRKFGKLTVLGPTEQREGHYVVWRCRCDCGKECTVSTYHLHSSAAVSCGCLPKPRSSAPLDLTGMRFGSLTALERGPNKRGRTAWRCRCDCGKEKLVTTQDLRRGSVKSCGCMAHSSPGYRDLAGRRIGYLTVLCKTEKRDYKGSVLWKCRCDCGNVVLYSEDALVHSRTVSCGCYRKNVVMKAIAEKPHRFGGTCVERLHVQKPRPDNKSGHVGIHKVNENCYRASIGFQGKKYHLGTYPTLEEAITARRRGEEMHLAFLNQYYRERAESGEK